MLSTHWHATLCRPPQHTLLRPGSVSFQGRPPPNNPSKPCHALHQVVLARSSNHNPVFLLCTVLYTAPAIGTCPVTSILCTRLLGLPLPLLRPVSSGGARVRAPRSPAPAATRPRTYPPTSPSDRTAAHWPTRRCAHGCTAPHGVAPVKPPNVLACGVALPWPFGPL